MAKYEQPNYIGCINSNIFATTLLLYIQIKEYNLSPIPQKMKIKKITLSIIKYCKKFANMIIVAIFGLFIRKIAPYAHPLFAARRWVQTLMGVSLCSIK